MRHYDELGLLRPSHIDPFTDYRYYTIDQLPHLNRILELKDLGLSLDQIKSLLGSVLSPDQLRGMLRLKRGEIEQQLQTEQARLARVESRLRQIEQEDAPPTIDVVLRRYKAHTLLLTRQFVPHVTDMAEHREQALMRLYAQVTQLKLNAGQEYVLYFHTDYQEDDIEMGIGVILTERQARTLDETVVPPFELLELPAAELACVLHAGYGQDVPETIVNGMRWIASNGYRTTGGIRECHLNHRETAELVQVLYEIQMPVERDAVYGL